MKENLITLLTTAYSSASYIQSYFEGVAGLQNIDAITVILVINEPDQHELAEIAKFESEHPGVLEVISVHKRESIAASLNRGIAACTTPFLAFLDIDDIRFPDSLSLQMKTLQLHPEALFTYGDFIVVPRQGETIGKFVEASAFDAWEFTRGCYASPTQFLRLELIHRCGLFDEQLRSGGDFDFQIRAATNGVFVKTNDPIVFYTKAPGSNSASSGHIQPLERTVVELRYGIYDKIDERYVDEAKKNYRIDELYFSGNWHHVSEFIPNYYDFLARREHLKDIGRINNRRARHDRRTRAFLDAIRTSGRCIMRKCLRLNQSIPSISIV